MTENESVDRMNHSVGDNEEKNNDGNDSDDDSNGNIEGKEVKSFDIHRHFPFHTIPCCLNPPVSMSKRMGRRYTWSTPRNDDDASLVGYQS